MADVDTARPFDTLGRIRVEFVVSNSRIVFDSVVESDRPTRKGLE